MPSAARPTPDAHALLAAAGIVLQRDGLEGLTVRAIAKEAGTTTMAIYSRLGGKDGVLDAINREGFLVLTDAIRHATATATERPAGRLSAICRTLRGFATAYPHHYRVMIGTPPSGYVRSDVAEKRTHDLFLLLREQVRALVGEETATGDTYGLFALCHGAIETEHGPMRGLVASADTAFNATIAKALQALEARASGAKQNLDLLSQLAGDVDRLELADTSARAETPRNAPCPCGSGKRYKHCHGSD